MMDISEQKRLLAAMHFIRSQIDATLTLVLAAIYAQWDSLSPATQALILRRRQELSTQLNDAVTSFERGIKINAFLKELETIDDIVAVAYAELVGGKTSEVYRNAGGPDQKATERIVSVLTQDPTQINQRTMSMPGNDILKTITDVIGKDVDLSVMDLSTTEQGSSYFTQVDFPAQIPDNTSDEHALVIQLVLDQPTESRVDGQVNIVFADPREPEYVEVSVTALGFGERTGVWTRTLAVSQGSDSQPAIFLLRLKETGSAAQQITVDFYHAGRNVGSFVFKTEVVAQSLDSSRPADLPADGNTVPAPVTRGTATVVRALEAVRLPIGAPPPVDVELRITRDGNKLSFTLHSARAYVGYHWRSMGTVELAGLADPAAYFAPRLERLSTLANKPVAALPQDEAEEYQIELAVLGYDLYKELFPELLRKEYWKLLKLRDKILAEEQRQMSLLITSDEPWVPWELVKPFEEGEAESDFLAGAFQLSRWLAGRGPMEVLSIRAAQLVAPDLDLDFVKDEVRYFASLAQAGVQVGPTIAAHADFIRLARRGGVQLIHVSTHGAFTPADVGSSPIKLQDKDLIPRDLSRISERGLVQDRPLVFFNTCDSGRLGLDLTKPGGWAQHMVDEFGVAAFVGSHWAINDQLAAVFSQSFYNALRQKKTLGEAFHEARITIRDRQPANPTWLAYTLYGDPNSQIELGE